MKKHTASKYGRLLAALLAILIIATLTALPLLAMDMGGRYGQHSMERRRLGPDPRTGTDVPPIGEGIESAADNVTDGIESAVEDIMPPYDSESDSALEDGTNIPDENISGALKDDDRDGISNAQDTDDDNDGILDSVDPDVNGDGTRDNSKNVGIIGIVIAVIIVIAIIVLIIAVMPKKKN